LIGAQYKKLASRVDALQIRERVLLLVACLAVLFFLVDTFGFQPVVMRQQQARQDITDQELKLELLRSRSGLLGGTAGSTPSATRAQLRAELDKLAERIKSRLGGMLAPDQAASVLEQVLTQEAGLTLHKVNAWSEPMTATEAGTGASVAVSGIGRYELELQLEGSYLATLGYLRALEGLPWNFFWKGVEFEITEYPKARVTLQIYTLGLMEG
jgi:MSHA biogenesis protein MshJ